jgi:hypothetical protein
LCFRGAQHSNFLLLQKGQLFLLYSHLQVKRLSAV